MSRFQKYFGKLQKKKASDIKVVALCVIAATTFWVLNALNKDNYSTVVNYPIEFQYNAEEYMAVKELPSEIKIEINGNGWDLFRKYFNFNVNPFAIELSNPDKQDYLLSSEYRRSLGEILAPTNLSAILTDTLKFDFDKIIESDLIVKIDTSTLELAPHHEYASEIIIDPISVHIKGPESKINALGDSLVIALNETGIQENFNQSAPIEMPEDLQPFIEFSPKNIQVTFEVVAFLEGNKRLKIREENFPKNVTLSRDVTSVLMNYRVDERKVSELRDLEFEGILNYRHRNKEDSTVTIEVLNLPNYIKSVEIEPNTFKLSYD
ncbi:YbbR-like domain-containing protein [Echinicola sp. CAU 1574]|uniref:YbbR-like domain-containing protein n=1 Tax=Echinicola arenosa TaxID=2774144 RepID=A0ABR9AMX7_9BACT|nr:YbbR-like domain-containing protein [Echinicola arenosa]MBD8489879.1 YbbR-like domain-containing protein [Echinicola arenosa]